jgi:apolipoprotein N-acyltransferase
MRVLISALLLAMITGCSLFQQQPLPEPEPIIKTVTKIKPLEIYQPPLPAKIRFEEVNFLVITAENLEEKVAELEKMQKDSFVIFAMTPQTYENMSYNLQEIRRYLLQQKEIILYYRKATTGEDGKTTADDWLEINEENQK